MQLSATVEASALLQENHAQREYFLQPLIFPGALGMIFAPPGVGKTFFALWLAAAVASKGSFLRWTSARPAKVYYVDGEMSSPNVSTRVEQIALNAQFAVPRGQLFFTAPDRHPDYEVPRISEPEGQKWYEKQLAETQCKVLVIDNLLTTSTPRARETDIEVWERTQPWLIKLRSQGICVVLVHHAGKGGSQLGSMRREVILNWIISLKRPGDYVQTDGARFEIHFQKGRDFVGEESEPMVCRLVDNGVEVRWDWKLLRQELKEIILKMQAAGMKEPQIAKEAGTSIFHVKTILAEATNGFKSDSDREDKPAASRGFLEREAPVRPFDYSTEPF